MKTSRIMMVLLLSMTVVCANSADEAGSAMHAVNIGLVDKGAYYVSAADIGLEAGLAAGDVSTLINAGNLSLKSRGSAVAYIPAAGGEGIYFYGEKLNSIYSDINIYRAEQGLGLVMGTKNGGTPVPADGSAVFADTVHFEQDNWALTGVTDDPESDYWQWDYVVAGNATLGSKPFGIDVRGVAVGSLKAKLTVRLLGVTASGKPLEHHAVIKLNGTQIGEATWDGKTWKNIEAEFDQGLLAEGSNTVMLTALKDAGIPYSTIYLGSMDLQYRRSYRAVNGQLLVRGDSNAVVTVGGFTNSSINVLDLSVTGMPAVVEGLTIDQVDGDYRVSFVPESAQTPYLVFGMYCAKKPVSMAADASSGLKDRSNKNQYLVITERTLATAAQSLADYRVSQGLSARVVFLDEIYDEFNDGIKSPMAIKAFLSYAFGNWVGTPEFVVLAGDGTYDYKDHKGSGDCIVPALMVGAPQGVFASDMKYADVNDDGVPEMAVGRLPAMTDDELQSIVSKIIAYELVPAEDWQKKVLLAADNSDKGGDFNLTSDDLAGVVTEGYTTEKMYLAGQGPASARAQITNAVNRGVLFFNYFGHGGVDRMAQEGLLVTGDAGTLVNSNRLPIVTAMSCVIGQFSIPGYDCLGEALLLAQNKGAIAVWAPSGMSYDLCASIMGREFYNAVFSQGEVVLGRAVLKAIRRYADTGQTRYMMSIYNLLGDPALRMGGGVLAGGWGPHGAEWKHFASMAEWKTKLFSAGELTDPAITGDSADSDGDGVLNVVEYALAWNPRKQEKKNALAFKMMEKKNPEYDAEISVSRRKGMLDIKVYVEVSDDLAVWSADPAYAVEAEVTDDGNGVTETVTYFVRSPGAKRDRCFIRLRTGKP